MTDQKETAITMWQDNHSGKRGHQLMTEKLADAIPGLGANANVADCDNVLASAKLFSPYTQLDVVHHRVGPGNRAVLRPGGGV